MNPLESIKSIRFFEGLPEDICARIAAISVIRTAPKDTLLFEAETPATGFFAMISGRVKIFRTAPSGKEHILHVFGPGGSLRRGPGLPGDHLSGKRPDAGGVADRVHPAQRLHGPDQEGPGHGHEDDGPALRPFAHSGRQGRRPEPQGDARARGRPTCSCCARPRNPTPSGSICPRGRSLFISARYRKPSPGFSNGSPKRG